MAKIAPFTCSMRYEASSKERHATSINFEALKEKGTMGASDLGTARYILRNIVNISQA